MLLFKSMKTFRFPVVIEWDEESKMYVAFVLGLPGAHTQAKSLDELETNVQEVVELCLEEAKARGETDFPEFVGVHSIETSL